MLSATGRRRGVVAALSASMTVLALAACGSTNAGGATSCGDFTRMSSDDQKSVIATMLGLLHG